MTTTEPILHDTMYEYTNDADITHYKHSNADKDAPEQLVEAFKPIDDPDFCVDWTDRLAQNGRTYIRVCWGEPEKSYLAEEAVFDCCYVRYTFTDEDDGSDYGEYVSDGRVYETREAAEMVGAPMIMHQGVWRSESDDIWTDDWNFDDEVAYRIEHNLSMNYDREV